MDATQMIHDSLLESDEEEEDEEENEDKRGRPLAKLFILKNKHIPETELPLFLGDNVLGRDPISCTLPFQASSVSKQHATICISAYRRRGCHDEVDTEALVWDMGSMNGTRKGRIKLTPHVRYSLSERDTLMVADIPCQYVTGSVDDVPSQGETRTPVTGSSGEKAKLPEASGERGGDMTTDGDKCVNGSTKAPDHGEMGKTPVRTNCLSLEETPNQPQGSLVPESDSDSDRETGGDRRHKVRVSYSDSFKSTPNSSTFLTPTSKIVPESEDESPITPSLSSKNKPPRHVSFRMEETEQNVVRQQLKEKKTHAIVDSSEEEDIREEERAAVVERKSEGSRQHVPVKQESHASPTRKDELPVKAPVLTDVIPIFNMDSDTDVEGEEEGETLAGPVTLNTNQHIDEPPPMAQFHMDSDTDVDEDNAYSDRVSKSVPSSADNTKPPHAIQPQGITMDSDTDVDEGDAAVSDAATKAKHMSFQGTDKADSAPSMQRREFHLDSDTDVDDEAEKECETNNTGSKIDETPTRLDISPIASESTAAPPHSLNPDNDTDEEPAPATRIEPSLLSAVPQVCTTADPQAVLAILSDSDTDVEEDSPLDVPVVTSLAVSHGTTSEAVKSDSDANTDVDDSSVPPAGDRVKPADLSVHSDTDVEDNEGGEMGENKIHPPGLLVPYLQKCSTPLQLPGGVEEMDTQAFLSPAAGQFSRSAAPAVRHKALSPFSDNQEDEDFVVAETQSFVLQNRDCKGNSTDDPTQAFGLESSGDENGEQSSRGGSFQLGLSDSSHLQGQVQALAMESTQAFLAQERSVNLEETQAHASVSNADRSPIVDLNMEATQAYRVNEEPARCSGESVKQVKVDFALEATQAYISEPYCDSEEEADEETTTAETQPLDIPSSSSLAMAETLPISAFDEEEGLDKSSLLTSGPDIKLKSENQTGERQECEEAAQPQEKHLSEAVFAAQTQPMCVSDSDEEELIICPRKGKAKPLQLQEEQTQPLSGSDLETQPIHVGVGETQPMATSGNGESDDEDLISGPGKRKAKQQQLEEEETQTLSNSQLSGVETQLIVTGEDAESSEEDSFPGPRKRRAKPKQLEESQSLGGSQVSAVETQPLETKTEAELSPLRGKSGQSEAQTSGITMSGRRETRARLRKDEEQAESSEPPKRQTRGTATRGRRGKLSLDEDEDDGDGSEEEEVEAKRTRGKTSLKKSDWKKEQLERQRKEKEDQERLQAENTERMRLEQEREERERKEDELKKIAERAQKEKEEQLERERKEKEESERLEREKAENEKLERERKEKEERERLEREKAETERLESEETERLEKERKEEEKERADRIQREKEQMERERKEKEESERIEHEKAEKEKGRLEKVKEQEENERLETEKREQEERHKREEQEQIEILEREEKERLEKEKQTKEKQENKDKSKPQEAARSQRASRRTTTASCSTQDSTISTNDDVPARRTRSRSNSSNSVSSERSASSANSRPSRGKGRGRGAKRTSETPRASTARSSNRRRTVASEPTEDVFPQGVLARSSSTNSLNSEISSCSTSSQSRGRGGRQRGRGRKTEPSPQTTPASSDHSPLKPPARGRKSRRVEESSIEVSNEDNKEKADSQQDLTTRGRQRANVSGSEAAPADKGAPSNEAEGSNSGESLLTPRSVRGKGQRAVKGETMKAPVAPAVIDGDDAKEKRKGRKRASETNPEEELSTSSKNAKEEEEDLVPEEKGKDDIPAQAKRKGRASTTQGKKNTKAVPSDVEPKDESEKMEEENAGRRGRGRLLAAQMKKEEQEESGTSVDQDAHVQAPEPKTPTTIASRKRQAPAESSPMGKTIRSSSPFQAAGGRSKSTSQTYKVLFTGVRDEAGERVLARLGGSLAKGVTDMNCLVTDKVLRTVKFLCAVAKGVPIVTTHWLEKSGKAGSFLSTNAFVVKDPEQEKKFSFCLEESLRAARSQPLLQGYEIHVTKSVKPEPAQMKDIISCSGATFLTKMPSSHKAQTLVISCEDDWRLCGPALSASLPVVTAEFILSGILQQKLDLQTHTLTAPASTVPPAGGRGRGRRRN